MIIKRTLFILCFCLPCWGNDSKSRVTSIFLSEHFINEQLKAHIKPGLLRDLKVDLDAKSGNIFLKGIVQIPIEELKAVNLDPSLSAYRFQLTIRPEATQEGFLILEFPLNETFFYPASSKDPEHERVFVPVQMLSLALASARGYFAALSGDFSSLDRKASKLKALIKAADKAIATEKNADAKEAMVTERDSLKLQLAAVPIERKQLAVLSKEVTGLLGFTGEKDLNNTFSARQNALILKLNLSHLTPYLTGVVLGGVRVVHDKRDGVGGENYFAVDINADLATLSAASLDAKAASDQGLKSPPSAVIRINQSLFESELIVGAEKQAMGSKLSDLKIEFKKDGLHVSGKFHKWFFTIPFDTIVDFDETDDEDDAFDVSVREVNVAGLDLEFMTGFILEALKNRLDQSLKGICTFKYVGEQKDHSRVLRVYMNTSKLIPALPGLHLVDIEIRDREFLLKVGDL